MEVLSEFPTEGPVALDAVELLRPDVALVDYWMVGIGGPALVFRIRSQVPECRVMLLSWFHGPNDIRYALDAGAVGFLPKSLTVAEVIEAVKRAHSGEPMVYSKELEQLVEKISTRNDAMFQVLKRLQALTPRELEVLTMLSFGASIQQVANKLAISPKTLKNHITSILAKSGAGSSAEAAAMARFCGLIPP